MGVVRRYIDFLIILLIPTPLVLCSSIPTSLFIFKMFFQFNDQSYAIYIYSYMYIYIYFRPYVVQ